MLKRDAGWSQADNLEGAAAGGTPEVALTQWTTTIDDGSGGVSGVLSPSNAAMDMLQSVDLATARGTADATDLAAFFCSFVCGCHGLSE